MLKLFKVTLIQKFKQLQTTINQQQQTSLQKQQIKNHQIQWPWKKQRSSQLI